MKRFLILIAMLSMLFVGYGTANAGFPSNLVGVDDNQPGSAVVIPVICEVGGGQDTLWAIANTHAHNWSANVALYNYQSRFIVDWTASWTADDIVSDNFCRIVENMVPPAQLEDIKATIGGTDYYIGYVIYFGTGDDLLIPWVYLTDLQKGFSSGFNGYSVAGGVGSMEGFVNSNALGIDELGAIPVDATVLYPRVYLHNDNPETKNWWIILAGRNNNDVDNNADNGVTPRMLTGFICNEEEGCLSVNIPIPNELNIINVVDWLPKSLWSGYPKAGFGVFNPDPYYEYEAPTWDFEELALWPTTILGWSYQRAGESTAALSWDAMHPIHREGYYCHDAWMWGFRNCF